MKKLLVLLLTAMMVFSFVSCEQPKAETVTVTIKVTGAEDKTVTVEKGSDYTLPAKPNVEGCFQGWLVDESEETKEAGSTIKVDANTTLTAKIEEHSWDEGNVTKQPTCTEEGEKTYTCSVCKKTKTVTLEALPHETDTETGKCSRCNTYFVDDYTKFSKAILTENAKIVLTGDITATDLSKGIQLNNNAEVDLNNHTLSFTLTKPLNLYTVGQAATIDNVGVEANLLFKNGSLSIKSGAGDITTAALSVEKGSITLDKVDYSTNISPLLPCNNSTITVKNGSNLNSTSNYGISTNNTYGTPPRIEVYDSTLVVNNSIKDDTAILMNGGGTVDIKNSTLKANRQCVIIRGGEATLENVKLIKTADLNDVETVNSHYDGKYDSGNEVAEAVIFIGSNGAEYKYDSSVTVKSGTTIEVPTDYKGEIIHLSGRKTYKAELTTVDNVLKGTSYTVFMHEADGKVTVNGSDVTADQGNKTEGTI